MTTRFTNPRESTETLYRVVATWARANGTEATMALGPYDSLAAARRMARQRLNTLRKSDAIGPEVILETAKLVWTEAA